MREREKEREREREREKEREGEREYLNASDALLYYSPWFLSYIFLLTILSPSLLPPLLAYFQHLFISLTPFIQLIVYKLQNSAVMLHLLLSSTVSIHHSSCVLANCMPPSPPPPSQPPPFTDFLLTLISTLFTLLMREVSNIFTLSSLWIVNSGTLYHVLFFSPSLNLDSFKCEIPKQIQN